MKSSFCSNSHGCVEVDIAATVRVRDDKLKDENGKPTSPVLHFSHEEWEDFIKGVKAGEFDL